MGHVIEWDNEGKTVVLQQYVGHATQNDLYHLAEKSAKLLREVDHTVHLIIDERAVRLQLTRHDITYLEQICPRNQGAVVIVARPDAIIYKEIAHQIAKPVSKRAFANAHYAHTVDEARAMLHTMAEVQYP